MDGKDPEAAADEKEVMIVGEVELSENELDLLRLGPGFMVVSSLEEQEMQVEASVTATKIRWSRMRKGTMDQCEKEIEIEPTTEEEETLADLMECELRDVLSQDGKEINMGRKRPTDLKNNREVHMPGPGNPKVEAEFTTRIGTWQGAFNMFRKENCRDNGTQVKSNLSVSQQIGLKSLAKKVAKIEVIVLQSDKGKSFVVVDERTYLSMANDHIAKDNKVSQKDIKVSQKILSSTARAMGNILGVGRSHSDAAYARSMDNLGGDAEDVHTLKIMPKTHKAPGPLGHPQSRPVVAAASGLSSRAGTSWQTSWILL